MLIKGEMIKTKNRNWSTNNLQKINSKKLIKILFIYKIFRKKFN